MVPVDLGISTTVASPIRTSRGSCSIVGAPAMKWNGGSTWVPVWDPRRSSETLAASPLVMRWAGTTSTGGSPGQVSIVGLIGSETSQIRPISARILPGVARPLAHLAVLRPCTGPVLALRKKRRILDFGIAHEAGAAPGEQ